MPSGYFRVLYRMKSNPGISDPVPFSWWQWHYLMLLSTKLAHSTIDAREEELVSSRSTTVNVAADNGQKLYRLHHLHNVYQMVLYIIGLGLGDEKDITIRGLECVKKCKTLYLEYYTSILGIDHIKLEKFYGVPIVLADRTMVRPLTSIFSKLYLMFCHLQVMNWIVEGKSTNFIPVDMTANVLIAFSPFYHYQGRIGGRTDLYECRNW